MQSQARTVRPLPVKLQSTCLSASQVTALGPPALLEHMSTVLHGLCPPNDRGAVSARLAEALAPHLEPGQAALLAAMIGRLDALAAAAHAKVWRSAFGW